MRLPPQENREAGTAGEEELTRLFKMIRLGSGKEVAQAVERYWNHIFNPQDSLQQHHVAVMELVSALYRFAAGNEIELDEEQASENMGELYARLSDMEPENLKNWLLEISLSFREKLITARSRSTKSFVIKAMEYVQNHYSDEDISLDHVCEILGVSGSYFSTIFKKETGNSFIGYLTDYRMEQAARLLIGTNEKSYIIAKQVGYGDPNYFSYVFKRKYGVSPSKYRTEHTERDR